MASIGNDPNGLKRILFVAGDGSRKTIRLGKATMKQAEAFKVKLESLVTSSITGGMDDETARWVAGLPDALRAKLAGVGLVAGREGGAGATLGAWLDEFFDLLAVKPSTLVTYRQTRRVLLDHFTAVRPIKSITPSDAEHWRKAMKDAGLAQATIARRVKSARQVFHKAVKRKLIAENPFADVKAGSMVNASRQLFVTRDMAERVLQECPNAQWRLLFALSRYGGLRTPSEPLALKWSDVLWDKDRIRLFVEKKEFEAGGERYIPIFPELRKPLMEAFEEAEPGEEYVITNYRPGGRTVDGVGAAMRMQLERIVRRAGLKVWPRLWHNMRATRETELMDEYPLHVVCAWIGNTPEVAMKHYVMVRGEHYTRAAGRAVETRAAQNPAQLPVFQLEAAQNPAQYTAETQGIDRKSTIPKKQNRPVLPSDSAPYVPVPERQMTPTGFEPVSRP